MDDTLLVNALAIPEDERAAYEVTDIIIPPLPETATQLPIVREDIIPGKAMLLHNFLSPEECEILIQYGEDTGLRPVSTNPELKKRRNNDRIAVRGMELAAQLYERVKEQLVNVTVPGRGDDIRSGDWEPLAVNEVFRLCKYHPGGHFSPHLDGQFVRHHAEKSFKTFMIYLNGGFGGGATNFLDDHMLLSDAIEEDGRLRAPSGFIQHVIVPRAGTCIVFDHEMLHEGAKLESGVKYILRSDIMFRNTTQKDLTERDYKAFELLRQGKEKEAAGEYEEATQMYMRAKKWSPHMVDQYWG